MFWERKEQPRLTHILVGGQALLGLRDLVARGVLGHEFLLVGCHDGLIGLAMGPQGEFLEERRLLARARVQECVGRENGFVTSSSELFGG